MSALGRKQTCDSAIEHLSPIPSYKTSPLLESSCQVSHHPSHQAVYPWDSSTHLKLPLFAGEWPFFGPQSYPRQYQPFKRSPPPSLSYSQMWCMGT
jgi:hypothetical protein